MSSLPVNTRSTTSQSGAVPCIDLSEALLNPAAVFVAPEDVLENPRLTHQDKVEILCRWLYDATELSVAEEEGMGGGEPSKLGVVLAALHTLTGGLNTEQAAPTKHGAICAVGTTPPAHSC